MPLSISLEVVQDIATHPGISRSFLDLDIAKFVDCNLGLNKPWSHWWVSTYFQTSHLEDQFPLGGLNSGTPCRWEIILKLYCYVAILLYCSCPCPYSAHYRWPPQGLATARDQPAALSDSTTTRMSLFDTFLLSVKTNQMPSIYQYLTKAIGVDAEDHRM